MRALDCTRYSKRVSACCALLLCASGIFPTLGRSQTPKIQNQAGVEMTVDTKDHDPALSVTVPDGPPDDRTFKILVPEHVTVRRRGEVDAQHLYIYGRNPADLAVTWKKFENTLEYSTDFGQIHFVAKATLVDDGIVFRYEFTNAGPTNYDMITAITDPRFRAVFYDPRLERTYVHHNNGFSLLASQTPERLTMPLTQWFPVRYLASYTAPIPSELVQSRSDGITYRYSPDRVDQPMIATLSSDGTWVAASFSRDPGNVWTNPELTCQHVDPQVPLAAGAHANYEVKILIFKGSLNDAVKKVSTQIDSLE